MLDNLAQSLEEQIRDVEMVLSALNDDTLGKPWDSLLAKLARVRRGIISMKPRATQAEGR